MKKITLMMAGGGVKAVSYLGILKAFEEDGIEVEVLAGSSGGALAAVAYALNKPFDESVGYLKQLSFWKLLTKNPLGIRKSFIDEETVMKSIREFYGEDIKFEDLKKKVVIFASNVQKAKSEPFFEGDVIMPLRASMALTPFFSSVKIGEYDYMDGSFLTVSPTTFLKEKYGNPVVCLLPAIEVFKAPAIVDNAMPYLKLILNNYQKLLFESDKADLTIFSLRDNAGHFMSFDKIDDYFQQGYEIGKENINAVKELINE